MRPTHYFALFSCLMALVLSSVLYANPGGKEQQTIGITVSDSLRQLAESLLKQQTMNLVFEENKGQWEEEILFQAVGRKGLFRVLRDGISITTFSYEESAPDPGSSMGPALDPDKPQSPSLKQAYVWNYRLQGMSPACWIDRHELATGKGRLNYYRGKSHITDVMQWKELRLRNVYPGIDMRLYGDGEGGLRYDFIVYPGADPSLIALELEGVQDARLLPDGMLSLQIGEETVKLPAPYSYQQNGTEEKEVPFAFALSNNTLHFSLATGASYDPSRILIIDPMLLEWSTYFAGVGIPRINDLIPLSDTSFVLIGNIEGTNNSWPVTPGAYQPDGAGDYRGIFASCFSIDGNLIWSTYLNGNSHDYVIGGDLWDDGSLMMCGHTLSDNFPVLNGFQETKAGSFDHFFLRLSSQGELVWSTYLGGDANDGNPDAGLPHQKLQDGSFVFYSSTGERTPGMIQHWPVTPNAPFPVAPLYAQQPRVLIRISIDGDLIMSTLLPGDIPVNKASNTYWNKSSFEGPMYNGKGLVASFSDSSIAVVTQLRNITQWSGYMPATPGALQTIPLNNSPTYVFSMDRDGSFNWGTYLSGSVKDQMYDVLSIDDTSFIMVGVTHSNDFPVSYGAVQGSSLGATVSTTLTAFHRDGSLLFSTYFGYLSASIYNAWGNPGDRPSPAETHIVNGEIVLLGFNNGGGRPLSITNNQAGTNVYFARLSKSGQLIEGKFLTTPILVISLLLWTTHSILLQTILYYGMTHLCSYMVECI
ncbi:MAG: hypothetical protein IH599_01910 [Bacteroidales bacterium]|nr:hypothetical protein [Bacteroidales bacterium]